MPQPSRTVRREINSRVSEPVGFEALAQPFLPAAEYPDNALALAVISKAARLMSESPPSDLPIRAAVGRPPPLPAASPLL